MSEQGRAGRFVGGGYRGRGYSRRPFRGAFVPHGGRGKPSLDDLVQKRVEAALAARDLMGPASGSSQVRRRADEAPAVPVMKRPRFQLSSATKTGVTPGYFMTTVANHRRDPDFFAACAKCGGIKHLSKVCPNLNGEDGFGLSCEYCLKDHNVHACPDLHHRCKVCLRRGHQHDVCPQGHIVRVRQFYVRFQTSADKGIWTHHRKKNVAYSFFAIPSWVQYDLLHRLSSRIYPKGRKGDEALLSDVDAFNHVLAALKELIALEGITSEDEMDLHLQGGLIKAIREYHGVVKRFGVSVSPDVPLAKLEPPPKRFEDLLPATDAPEEDEEYVPQPSTSAAATRTSASHSERRPLLPAVALSEPEGCDDDMGEDMEGMFRSPKRTDPCTG